MATTSEHPPSSPPAPTTATIEALAVFEHQVAGSHSSCNSQLMRGEVGKVLKPYKLTPNSPLPADPSAQSLLAPNKGTNTEDEFVSKHGAACTNERKFYELLSSRDDLAALRRLTPRYYGEATLWVTGALTPHIVLEDLTLGCRLPCVADVKMGAIKGYPGIQPHKLKGKEAKYSSLSMKGWCIAGMKQHSPAGGGKVLADFGPTEGRTLNLEQVQQYLRSFVMLDSSPRGKELLRKVTERIEDIWRWFKEQRMFWFRSSSILIVYNAEYFMQTEEFTQKSVSAEQITQNSSNKCCTEPLLEEKHNAFEESRERRHIQSSDISGNKTSKLQKIGGASSDTGICNGSLDTDSTNVLNSTLTNDEGFKCTAPQINNTLHATSSKTSEASTSTLNNDSLLTDSCNLHGNTTAKESSTNSSQASLYSRDLKCSSHNLTTGEVAKSSFSTSNLILNVKMIDFAHVMDALGEVDAGYMTGLENLLEFLRSCKLE
uniref:Kinase n=1 Tax=Hirondellea gigas TaxID=1518452 RepID=A0A6A7G5I6_9CRUS